MPDFRSGAEGTRRCRLGPVWASWGPWRGLGWAEAEALAGRRGGEDWEEGPRAALRIPPPALRGAPGSPGRASEVFSLGLRVRSVGARGPVRRGWTRVRKGGVPALPAVKGDPRGGPRGPRSPHRGPVGARPARLAVRPEPTRAGLWAAGPLSVS